MNALLDGAAVLPTSGSRGCTSTVVELNFNKSLLVQKEGSGKIPVYHGEVQFIAKKDWFEELRSLVGDCSETGIIFEIKPEGTSDSIAGASWQKINQVYGKGTMEQYHGQHPVTQNWRCFPQGDSHVHFD